MKNLIAVPLVITCMGCGLSLQDLRREALQTPAGTAVPTPGDSHARYVPRLIAFAESRGFTVSFEPMPGMWGATNVGARRIVMNGALAPNGVVEGLCHEIAHTLEPSYLNTGAGEVWVEGVAATVVAAIGLAPSRAASVQYLANHKASLVVIERERDTIRAAARAFLKEIQ